MSITQPHTQSQAGPVFSLLAAGIVALGCLILELLSAHLLEPFAAMFKGLGVELPWPTRFLLETHAWPFRLVFVVLAIFVIWKEFSISDLRRRLVLTARTLFAALLTGAIAVSLLYLPVFVLAKKLTEAK